MFGMRASTQGYDRTMLEQEQRVADQPLLSSEQGALLQGVNDLIRAKTEPECTDSPPAYVHFDGAPTLRVRTSDPRRCCLVGDVIVSSVERNMVGKAIGNGPFRTLPLHNKTFGISNEGSCPFRIDLRADALCDFSDSNVKRP